MFLSRLKFRTRLFFVFVIVFILFLVTVFFSIKKIEATKTVFSDLYNYSLTINKETNNVYININQIHHLLEDLVTTNSADTVKLNTVAIAEKDSIIHKKFGTLYNHFIGNVDVINKAYTTYKEWLNIRNDVIALKVANKTSEAGLLETNKCDIVANELFDKILNISSISKQWADSKYFNNLKQIEKLKQEFFWITLSFLLVSIVLIIVIENSISKPIKKLIKKIEINHHILAKSKKDLKYKSEQELLELSINQLNSLTLELDNFNKNLELKVKETAKDLHEREERYTLAVDATNLGIWDWNLTQKTIYFSEVWKTQIGYKNDELENTFSTFRNLLHPKHIKRVLEQISAYVKKPEGQFVCDFKLKHKNGTYIWIQSTAKALINDQGKTTRLFGMHRDITKYIINEKELKKQYRQLQIAKEKAVDNKLRLEKAQSVSKMGFLEWDLETNNIFLSKQVVNMFKLAPTTKYITPNQIPELVPKEELKTVQQSLNKALKGNGKHNIDHRIIRGDGTILWVQTQADLLYDSDGNPLTLLGTVVDITDRKTTEFSLIKSEEFSDAILQTALSAIISVNNEGTVLTWNKAAEKIFGYTANEIVNDTFYKIIPKKYTTFNKRGKQQLKKEFRIKIVNNTLELEGIRKNGTQFPIELSMSKWGSKSDINYTGIIRDITERKESEKENQKLLTAVEQSANAIMITDINGFIEYVNPAFKSLTGYSLTETLGKRPDILKSGKQSKAFYKQLWSQIIKGENWKGVFINKTKGGNLFWDETTITPIKNNKGKIINYLSVKQDITEVVKSKEATKKHNLELKIAKEKAEESNRLKTEFLNNMSHEIRTPMNGILGFSEQLSNANLTDEKRRNFVKIIQNSSNQLLHIIDDILEISYLETKQVTTRKESVCLNEVLFELFSIFDIKAKENKTPLYFKKSLSDSESTIISDSLKLNKIVANLLENALKFTSKGYIEFGYYLTENQQLIIYVKDTGIGIKLEKQKIIFERFSQAEKELSKKTGGLGLGLSIAKENTELLGGKISVDSKFMKGATFAITLPYKPVYIKSNKIDKTEEIKLNNNKCTILIAEDEEVNFLFLEILLKDKLQLNCELLHAKDGIEAVDYCKKNTAIKIVLMDIKMPKMNGYEATQKIKKMYPNLPVIAQTAYSTKEDKGKAFAAGCDDFISKPIKKDLLESLLNKYIPKG